MWRVVVLVFVLALGELAVPSSAAYGQREESEGHCKTNEDCGADSKKYLIHKQDTCSGRCGAGHDPSKTCQCNTHCGTYGDCCADYHALCTQQTCSGRCNAALDNSKPCQCNSACVNFGDCCPDYQTLCV
ncbi:uridylate-specific endoribonuclease-like, partial [Saccostrea cucullata]|uniref:uridylate-specific endoribonuclease-like n=1 Tax=Saccostrea cuccullata TaxID=36930 RepID=UPI002ED57877